MGRSVQVGFWRYANIREEENRKRLGFKDAQGKFNAILRGQIVLNTHSVWGRNSGGKERRKQKGRKGEKKGGGIAQQREREKRKKQTLGHRVIQKKRKGYLGKEQVIG